MANEFVVKNGLITPTVQLPGATSGTVTLSAPAVAGTTTIALPATAGTIVTTGDTGTVTNTMLAGSIANNKLANSTISGTALGGNLPTATFNVSGTGLSGSATYNGTTASTFTVTSNATSANTVSTIVSRDVSGNFSAGTITAALNGNASTASTLQTARTITLSGDVAGSVSFNGSTNVTITTTIQPDSVALGTDTTGNYVATVAVSGTGLSVSGSGVENAAVTVTSNATNANTASTIVARDASGNFSAGTITAALSGNASTASALQTARTISLTGDVTGSVSFDGSGNAAIATTIQPDSVALGTDTTGNYMVNVTAGTGVSVSHTQGEGSTATVSIGQAVGTTDNVTFNNVTVNGTLNSDDITSTNISVSGNATITGNLTVSGTTTTVNSTTISIADANIELARNATTAAQANGAGLTVTGPTTAATLTYTSADDRWNFNKNLNVGTVFGALSGNASTATTLQTARTINGVSFDGSANISFNTSSVSEGTNLYYTDTRARAALSFTAGSGAYNSSTGVITIPTNTNQLTNGAGFITGYTETDTLATVTGRGASTSTVSSFNGGGGDGLPALRINQTSAGGSANWLGSFINSGLNAAAGKWGLLLLGQAESSKNSGYLGFQWQGNSSNSNAVTLGLYAADNLLRVYGGGYTEMSGSSRAPIFYDLDNTGYYLDPNSGTSLVVAGIVKTNADRLVLRDDSIEVHATDNDSAGVAINYYGYASGTTRFRDFNVYDGKGGLRFKTYGSANYAYSPSSFRAPIFYDSDNTGYYVDPNSTSNFYSVQFLGGKWYTADNSSGNSIDIYVRPNGDNTYIWRHIYGGSGTGYGTGVGGYGIYSQTLGGDYSLIFNSAGHITAPYSVRSPIFYDSQDTTYYTDPNSTSWLRHLSVGDINAANDGGWNARLNLTGSSHARLDVKSNSDGIVTTMYSHTGQGVGRVGTYSNHPLILMAQGGAEGGTVYNGSLRSSIFYDSGNTSYYVDPADGGFNLRGGTSNRVTYTTNDSGFRVNNAEGNGVTDLRLGAAWGYPGVYSSTYLMLGSENYIEFRTQNVQRGYIDNSANLYALGSMRSPIFYNYSDTNYYLDPDSYSFLNSVSVNVGNESTGAGNGSTVGLTLRGNYNSNSWAHKFHKYDNGNGVPLYLSYTSGASSWIGLQGWGAGLSYTSHLFGSFAADSAVYSPIFYDKDNTAYWGDFNDISKMYSVQAENLGGAVLNRVTSNIGVATGYREAITFIDGSTVQAHVSTKDGSGNCYQWYTTEWIYVDPEKDYEFSFWVRSDGTANIYFGWNELDGSGNYIASNPYFSGGMINTNSTWVKRTALLRNWRTPSSTGDTNGSDRYASTTSRNSGPDVQDGVMHSATRRVQLRFGTCYGGTSSGQKTYFHLASIREVTGHDRQTNILTLPYFNGSNYSGSMNFRTFTSWDSVSGIDLIGGSGEFRMSSDSGQLNLRVDGWMYAYDNSYFPLIYDQQDTNYYFDGNSTTRTNIIQTNYIGVNQAYNSSWPLIVNGNAYLNTGGYGQAEGSWRAPVFYDSNDTAFYLNPRHESRLSGLRLDGIDNQASGTDAILWINKPNNNDWAMIVSGGLEYGIDLQMAASHSYAIRALKNGTQYSRLGTDLFLHDNQIHAPIFYDYNDTNYYVDPNSNSIINTLRIAQAGNTALYIGSGDTSRTLNDGSTRTGISITGYAYPHIDLHATQSGNITHGAVFSMTGGLASGGFRRFGIGVANYNPNEMSFGWYDNDTNPHYGVGVGWTYPASMWFDTSHNLFARGSMRSPIFYDYNDTGYYIDPNSTTSIRTVGSWRSDSSTWDGEFSGKIQYHSNSWYLQAADAWYFRNSAGTNVATINSSGYIFGSYFNASSGNSENPTIGQIWTQSTSDNYLRKSTPAHFRSQVIDGNYLKLYGTVNNNIDSDYGECSITFDPVPSGTPPISSPNIRTLNLGNDFNRRTQLAFDYASNRAWFRRRNEGGWSGWLEFYHTGNLTNLNQLTNGPGYIVGLTFDGLTAKTGGTGTYTTTGDFRAPIFYNHTDTGYYVDPDSLSVMNRISLGYNSGDNNSIGCSNWFRSSGTTGWYNASYGGGINMEDSTWVRVYNNKQFYAQNYILSDSSVRAPIFYESANTAWYVDPGSNSFFSGNLSLGTTFNPTIRLHVRQVSSSTTTIDSGISVLNDAGTQGCAAGIRFSTYAGEDGGSYAKQYIGGVRSASGAGHGPLVFCNRNAADASIVTLSDERMRIDPTGFVQASVDFRSPIYYDSGNTAYYVDAAAAGTSVNVAGSIIAAGNVTAYSDIRLKTNIRTIDNAIDKIKKIRGVTFDRTDNPDLPRQAGVIAQEVKEVLPEVVSGSEESKYTVAYGNMVGLLIEAIKEQQSEIDELKALVKQLLAK